MLFRSLASITALVILPGMIPIQTIGLEPFCRLSSIYQFTFRLLYLQGTCGV